MPHAGRYRWRAIIRGAFSKQRAELLGRAFELFMKQFKGAHDVKLYIGDRRMVGQEAVEETVVTVAWSVD